MLRARPLHRPRGAALARFWQPRPYLERSGKSKTKVPAQLAPCRSLRAPQRRSYAMAQESLEVLTQDLLPGMFVEDLDRPWLDTPFLIQGFLLDDKHDIETLRQLCHHVYVDPLRSTVPMPLTQSGQKRPLAPEGTGAGVARPLEVIRPSGRSKVGGERPARDRAPVDDDDRASSATSQRPKEKITLAPGPRPVAHVPAGADWPPAGPAQPASAPDAGASGVLFNPLSRLKGLFDGLAHAWRETRLPSVPLPDAADANPAGSGHGSARGAARDLP